MGGVCGANEGNYIRREFITFVKVKVDFCKSESICQVVWGPRLRTELAEPTIHIPSVSSPSVNDNSQFFCEETAFCCPPFHFALHRYQAPVSCDQRRPSESHGCVDDSLAGLHSLPRFSRGSFLGKQGEPAGQDTTKGLEINYRLHLLPYPPCIVKTEGFCPNLHLRACHRPR